MQILIIFALLIAIVAVIFAMQNLEAVTVSFFFWQAHASLALVLLITLTAGVLISVLVSLPGLVRGKWATAGQRKKRTALELERETFRQRAEAAEKEVKELELQLASLSAELEKHLPDEVTKTLPD